MERPMVCDRSTIGLNGSFRRSVRKTAMTVLATRVMGPEQEVALAHRRLGRRHRRTGASFLSHPFQSSPPYPAHLAYSEICAARYHVAHSGKSA